MQPDIGQGRLRGAQKCHFLRGGQNRKRLVHVEGGDDARLLPSTRLSAANASTCTCTCVRRVCTCRWLELGPHQQRDGGQSLRDRVMDVTRNACALREGPRVSLRERQFLLQIGHLLLRKLEGFDKELPFPRGAMTSRSRELPARASRSVAVAPPTWASAPGMAWTTSRSSVARSRPSGVLGVDLPVTMMRDHFPSLVSPITEARMTPSSATAASATDCACVDVATTRMGCDSPAGKCSDSTSRPTADSEATRNFSTWLRPPACRTGRLP